MPIPKPKPGETEKDFISRCMGDKTMNEDFPKQARRSAVCYGSWDAKAKAERQNYKKWSKESAKDWLKKHDFKTGNYEKLANYHSFRQENPDKYDDLRTEKAPFDFKEKDGVLVIYGIYQKDGERTTEIQSIRFYHGEEDKKGKKDMEKQEGVAVDRNGDITILVSTKLPSDVELKIITISDRLGIKALYSLNRKKILEFYFDVYKDWNSEKATEWYNSHKSIKAQPEEQAKRFFKINEERRIVYGVVLIPWEIDLQGDIMTDEEIEKAAHRFVESFQNVDEMHKTSGVGTLLESYISPVGFVMGGVEVTKGSWILVTRADKKVWEKIKEGELVGYSVGYIGKRSEEEA